MEPDINMIGISTSMIQFFTGIVMSSAHVISGPDHLAAVTPLAIENRTKSWHIGLFWGIGHVMGMLLIGLLYLAFRDVIPVEGISGYSEILVGTILIGIGAWALLKVLRHFHTHHKHPHYHDKPESIVHIHSHDHGDEQDHTHGHQRVKKQNNFAAMGVGTIHGFAGISHFLLILPTLMLPTWQESVIYLAGFAVGTIFTMILYALALGIISARLSRLPGQKFYNRIRIVAGAVAILVGIFWLIKSFI
jgi:ABC-type nickel/cobalt efflux system permease component RcnA